MYIYIHIHINIHGHIHVSNSDNDERFYLIILTPTEDTTSFFLQLRHPTTPPCRKSRCGRCFLIFTTNKSDTYKGASSLDGRCCHIIARSPNNDARCFSLSVISHKWPKGAYTRPKGPRTCLGPLICMYIYIYICIYICVYI